jgi:5,10-methylenetetrahydrofolate reductase
MAGRSLQGSPSFCLGAAANPNASSLDLEIEEMTAKEEAGAEFFQTQPVYDTAAFARFMELASSIRVPVLAGLFLLRSARMARYMHEHVPEVCVPPWVIRDLEESADPSRTGQEIAARTLESLRGLCAGAHVMTMHQEDRIVPLLDEAGL